MVALSPRFTLLASLAAIASFALLPAPVDGAAIQLRHSAHSKVADNSTGTDRGSAPTLPLPERKQASKVKSKGKERSVVQGTKNNQQKSKQKSLKEKEKRWNIFDNLLEVGGICLGIDCPNKRDGVVVSGDNQHLHIHTDSNGNLVGNPSQGDYVNIQHRSPSPEPHNHDHHKHTKLVVNGDNDHIDGHEKRSFMGSVPLFDQVHTFFNPALIPRHNHGYSSHHRSGGKVIVNGDNDDVDMAWKREVYSFNGVPGNINIMSPVAGSADGQRIASLSLTPSDDTSFIEAGDPFVLNASETNSTQVYLVTMPDAIPTAPLNQTAPDPTMDNSTVPDSSNSTLSGRYRKCTIQIPLFDSEEAVLKPYCATFDPRPASPAPLTVEACRPDNETDSHKSQVFAFEPLTGVIRPMWFEGENDGTEDDVMGPTGDPQDSMGDDASDENAATVDPTTPFTSKMVTATGIHDVMDEEFGENTRPPNAMAALAKTFAAVPQDYASAKNVTLVFIPLAPTIPIRPSNQTVPSQEKIAAGPESNTTYSDTTSMISTTSSSTSATSTAVATGKVVSETESSASASHTFAAAAKFSSSANHTGSTTANLATATANVTSSASTSSPTTVSSTVTFSPFAAFAATTSAVSMSSSASAASSTSLTSSAGVNGTATATASPTASPLDVEVYDPSASSGISSSSSTSSTSPTASLSSSSSVATSTMTTHSNATPSSVSSSAAASLTPSAVGSS